LGWWFKDPSIPRLIDDKQALQLVLGNKGTKKNNNNTTTTKEEEQQYEIQK